MRQIDVPDGLFGEQVPDGPYPKEVLVGSFVVGGLRCVEVGEDAEWVVYLGHPPIAEVFAAAAALAALKQFDLESVPTSADHLLVTQAWIWTSCPLHAVSQHGECEACWVTGEMDTWLLKWDVPPSRQVTPSSWKVAPWPPGQYELPVAPVERQFPVTIWDTH